MATVKKHVSKDGKITYYIRVFNGFDGNGKKIGGFWHKCG